jgi:hypothetical protein
MGNWTQQSLAGEKFGRWSQGGESPSELLAQRGLARVSVHALPFALLFVPHRRRSSLALRVFTAQLSTLVS